MIAVEFVPHGASWLTMAWAAQASLTVMASVGMITRLLRRQRRLDA